MVYERDRVPIPVKFKITNKDESESVVKINRIIKKSKEKLAGNRMLLFDCLGVVGEKER